MKIIFLVNCLISLIIFLFLFLKTIENYKSKKIKDIVYYPAIIGIFYFIFSLLSLLWFFNFFEYSPGEFLFFCSLLILIQVLLLFRIIYLISGNKNIFYFLLFYFLIIFSYFYSWLNPLNTFLVASSLIGFVLFVICALGLKAYKKVCYAGIFYSLLSIILYSLILFGLGGLYFFSLLLNIVFFVLMFVFFKCLKKHFFYKKHAIYKRKHLVFIFLRYFVFIVTITIFIFIGTVGIHEFGHFSASKFYDCEFSRIVYEKDFPYTETLCRDASAGIILLLGGIFLPFIISLLLFIVGGTFIQEISVLIAGSNLMVSLKDFVELGISNGLIMVFIIFGMLLLISGIIFLTRSIMTNYFHLIFDL